MDKNLAKILTFPAPVHVPTTISQSALARSLGISRITINKWINGRENVGKASKILLALLASGKVSLKDIEEAKEKCRKTPTAV